MTLAMCDNDENGDSCACMEENKNSNIKTIFSFTAPVQTEETLNETRIVEGAKALNTLSAGQKSYHNQPAKDVS